MNDALITDDIFPNKLKLADITPVHKKDETTNKENYRPVSVLPLISKIFERVTYDQLSSYLEKYINIIYYVVLGKLIPHNMLYSNYYKHGKKNLIDLVWLEPF